MNNPYYDLIKAAETMTEPEFLTAYPGMESLCAAVNRTMPEIVSVSGLSGRDICRRFGISYRTMEDWTAPRRACPVYVRLMIQELLGIYSPLTL